LNFDFICSQVGSFVFVDLNDNGYYDSNNNEFGYNGLAVNLLQSNGTVLASSTTNSTGNYLFGDLYPGNYR
jgi:serine-aspartate repeat-containing protein C/D/E